MLRLAMTQGVKFWVRAGRDIPWPDGSVMVPAGSVGAAVIPFGGAQPGWIVEWERHGICAIAGADEGVDWHRVMRSPAQLRMH